MTDISDNLNNLHLMREQNIATIKTEIVKYFNNYWTKTDKIKTKIKKDFNAKVIRIWSHFNVYLPNPKWMRLIDKFLGASWKRGVLHADYRNFLQEYQILKFIQTETNVPKYIELTDMFLTSNMVGGIGYCITAKIISTHVSGTKTTHHHRQHHHRR